MQRSAAKGLCRLIWRIRDVRVAAWPTFDEISEALSQKAQANWTQVAEAELELDLPKWLPGVKRVLIDRVVDPASSADTDPRPGFTHKGLEQIFLMSLGLFGDDASSELKDTFLAKLSDLDLHAADHYAVKTAVHVAMELASAWCHEARRPNRPRPRGAAQAVQEETREEEEARGISSVDEETKVVLSAIVRCERVWADREQVQQLRRLLRQKLRILGNPTRRGLARALGIAAELPPATEEEAREEAEEKAERRRLFGRN
ncbi:uncharacterized protein ACA1_247560 [Acanthamoeba castellanii str. Neff]|uniref:Uncharacterized protein n=1 Tax=Acanthamoeba castellanii (strain ATCC 30010 / Neff) TaxID=1257118 RepID=L8GL24_ACACF|nr:uncharacterized protein ACA1_247560 [Acanthamoeba castellanii str. Neff]ELR13529.1 hypothetical protein ACA1_247560 [Acanthamoeba castellanii str. Neff]